MWTNSGVWSQELREKCSKADTRAAGHSPGDVPPLDRLDSSGCIGAEIITETEDFREELVVCSEKGRKSL